MGASPTLPWIKRTSRKKELRAASHVLTVSHVSDRNSRRSCSRDHIGVGATCFFSRVIRVHTQVGDVDRGVCHDRSATLVGQATGAVMAIGLLVAGVILRGAKVG
jgi:hypothetical protein